MSEQSYTPPQPTLEIDIPHSREGLMPFEQREAQKQVEQVFLEQPVQREQLQTPDRLKEIIQVGELIDTFREEASPFNRSDYDLIA